MVGPLCAMEPLRAMDMGYGLKSGLAASDGFKSGLAASDVLLDNSITQNHSMRTSSPRFAARSIASSDARETAVAALSTAEALTALLTETLADRRTPPLRDGSPLRDRTPPRDRTPQGDRTPQRGRTPQRDRSPVVRKRSLFPAQAWAAQARLEIAFESIITYSCGATISIQKLANLLIPLAQSDPRNLEKVADIVAQRDHIPQSLTLYRECDAQSNGFLAWEGGQLYNFVVSVFRYYGFLPPFSGQVKDVAEQFHFNRSDTTEFLEARECLCVVDALLQALTFAAREKTVADKSSSRAHSPLERDACQSPEILSMIESNRRCDEQLKNLIENIEAGLESHSQLLTSTASPPVGTSPTKSVSPISATFPTKSVSPISATPPQQVSNLAGGAIGDAGNPYLYEALQCENNKQLIVSLHERALASDIEVKDREQTILILQAELRHLSEELRQVKDESESQREMIQLKDKEIRGLLERQLDFVGTLRPNHGDGFREGCCFPKEYFTYILHKIPF